jgi:xanthine dehydrogenase accessory factor
MADWLDALRAFDEAGRLAVLVTVLSARGSTPREAGCKMVVGADSLHGTIGGGNLEYQSLNVARALLSDPPAAPVLRDFPLGPALGQCCGGHASVLFEVIRPPSWHVALFGAGHVGQALVRLLGTLPCRVAWIDPRADAFPPDIPPNIRRVPAEHPAEQIALLPPGAVVLVMTHDHGLDLRIVTAALAREDLAAVGLIGSETKRARFVRRLQQSGLSPEAVSRLICPIGLPGIGGKLPAEIAVAVAAQLLHMRGSMRVPDGMPQKRPTLADSALAHACGAPDCSCAPTEPVR